MERIRCISRNGMKYIAAVCMVCDHFGELFLEYGSTGWIVCRMVLGRIAWPIFAVLFMDGMLRTRHPGRNMLVLAVSAVVAEPCFDLMIYGTPFCADGQNVMFLYLITGAAAFLCIRLDGMMRDGTFSRSDLITWSVVVWCAAVFFCCVFRVDYSLVGSIGLAVAFYILRSHMRERETVSALTCGGLEAVFSVQPGALIPAGLFLFYDPDRECRHSRAGKYFFYVFYPAHMLLLYGLSVLFAA